LTDSNPQQFWIFAFGLMAFPASLNRILIPDLSIRYYFDAQIGIFNRKIINLSPLYWEKTYFFCNFAPKSKNNIKFK